MKTEAIEQLAKVAFSETLLTVHPVSWLYIRLKDFK
jgi:hypothetical protein